VLNYDFLLGIVVNRKAKHFIDVTKETSKSDERKQSRIKKYLWTADGSDPDWPIATQLRCQI